MHENETWEGIECLNFIVTLASWLVCIDHSVSYSHKLYMDVYIWWHVKVLLHYRISLTTKWWHLVVYMWVAD